ncbi:MAG: polyprenyl synthetase family protein, partial [Longimicrobiales bacterium]
TAPSGALLEPASYWFRVRGRRIRPLALLAACELVGGRPDEAVDAACAIELIHTSSLILDDLPCMDDAVERRGIASLHLVFGDATALLTALLLLNLAHRRLASLCAFRGGTWHERICQLLGGNGMIGGQDVDLRSSKGESLPSSVDVANVRLLKTTSLMVATLELGGWIGGAPPRKIEALGQFGFRLGRLLQLVDDLVDGDAGSPRILNSGDALASIDEERLQAGAVLHGSFEDDVQPRRVLDGLAQLLIDSARTARLTSRTDA